MPVLEQRTDTFYQYAVLKPNLYFEQPEATLEDLEMLARKLFVYHPALRNITNMQRDEILNSNSWEILSDFLNNTIIGGFDIDGLYG